MKESKIELSDLKVDQIVKIENWGFGRIIEIINSNNITIEFELDDSIETTEACILSIKLKAIKEIVKNSKKLF